MSQLEELIKHITNSRRILVFTGAGISTGAGIPDYRGPQGVWKTRTPVTVQEFMADEADRKRYWFMKSEDWNTWSDARPTPAHTALVALQKAGKLLLCATQNIDGLHAKAGLTPEHLVELHGSNAVTECMQCGSFQPAAPFYDAYREGDACPACPDCGGWLKPGVISFGQALREHDLHRVQLALPQADLVLALGSTLSVQPAANFPLLAARNGVPYFVINRGETHHDGHPLVLGRLEGDLQNLVPAAVEQALAMNS